MKRILSRLDSIAAFKVKTANGMTYAIPCDSREGKELCAAFLQNTEIVSLLAGGRTLKNIRYINDSARSVLLVEV